MPAKFNAIGVIADRLGVRGGAPALRWAASLRSLPRRRAAPARASDRVDGFTFGRLEGLWKGPAVPLRPAGLGSFLRGDRRRRRKRCSAESKPSHIIPRRPVPQIARIEGQSAGPMVIERTVLRALSAVPLSGLAAVTEM
jgi:hypothetical protein